jgi:hypothetical protein
MRLSTEENNLLLEGEAILALVVALREPVQASKLVPLVSSSHFVISLARASAM